MKYRDKETGDVVEAEDGYVLGIKLITVTREGGVEAYLPDDFRELFEPLGGNVGRIGMKPRLKLDKDGKCKKDVDTGRKRR